MWPSKYPLGSLNIIFLDKFRMSSNFLLNFHNITPISFLEHLTYLHQNCWCYCLFPHQNVGTSKPVCSTLPCMFQILFVWLLDKSHGWMSDSRKQNSADCLSPCRQHIHPSDMEFRQWSVKSNHWHKIHANWGGARTLEKVALSPFPL